MTPAQTIPRAVAFPLHTANALTGEVPLWDAGRQTLWWADVQGQRLLACEPETGRNAVYNLPAMPGLIALRKDGSLLLGLEDGFYPFDPATGLHSRLIAVEEDNPHTRINDGKADAAGRLWFGTMNKAGPGAPTGSFYRLDPDGSLHLVRPNVEIPNAIALAPDGETLYFADTATRTIEAIPYDLRSGKTGEPRAFIRYEDGGKPDGACVDAEGGLWVAVVGGGRIERRRPDGSLDMTVELPVSRPTMPMLGGSDGHTLFVTSQRRLLTSDRLSAEPLAGDLLAIRVNASAVEQHRVAF